MISRNGLVIGATFLSLAAGPTDPDGFSAPQRFAPNGVSATAHDTAPSFFPGGREVIFEHSEGDRSELRIAHRVGQGWSTPVTLPFSGKWDDLEPAVAVNGSFVIFASSRPIDGGSTAISGHWSDKDWPNNGGNLWRADRRPDGTWSEPRRLPASVNRDTSVFEPALTRDGTLFFMRPDDKTNRFRLFVADPRDGYTTVKPLDFWQPGSVDVDPAVAPDQSYMVFGSSRATPGKLGLFVSFRRSGGWSTPIALPEAAWGGGSATDTHLSADQATLYFRRDGGIWQVPFGPLLAWAKRHADR